MNQATVIAGQRQPPCAVCTERDTLFRYQVHEQRVYECRACGLHFFSPQPTDGELAAIYTADYFLGSEDVTSRQRVADLKQRTAARHTDLLRKHVGLGGRVLEVGCGKGEFLVESRLAGFDVYGLEYSADAAAAANRRLEQERVQVGQVGTTPLDDCTFDAIAFFDVIEHVRDPLEFMRRIARALKPGGVVLLTTPVVDSLSARIMRRHWMEYKVEHLFYFTQRSLRKLFDDAGLDPVDARPNIKVLSFDYIYRHFARFRVPLVTPALGLVRRCVPESLANRPITLTASGSLLAVAKKPHD